MKIPKPIAVRYLAVGGVAYATEMVALYILHNGIKLSSVASVAMSFWVGFVVAFVLQKWVTFQNYDRTARTITGQLLGYSLLVAWNYGVTLGAVTLFSAMLSVFLIRTITIVIITSWNFAMYAIIFRSPIEKK